MRLQKIILPAFIFLLGMVLGIFVKTSVPETPKRETEIANTQKLYPMSSIIRTQRQSGLYQYTNPLLDCDAADETLRVFLKPFTSEFTKYVSAIEQREGVSTVAVVLRDLIGGWRTAYNDQVQFVPASLNKVPLFMAVLKRVEQDPSYLEKAVVLTISNTPTASKEFQNIQEPPLLIGKSYSIKELLENMIIYSSNKAALELASQFSISEIGKVGTDLGINIISGGPGEATISVSDYVSFFRVLYNSSYLSPNLSEYALTVLTNSKFREGIVAGVPESVPVAHKFGERIIGATEESQLHDCGIIYYSKRPYILCVMTKGRSFSSLKTAIKDISSFIFTKISEQYEE